MSVGVESGTKHVLRNLRLEQPPVGSWANNWASPRPSIVLLPSPNPLMDPRGVGKGKQRGPKKFKSFTGKRAKRWPTIL